MDNFDEEKMRQVMDEFRRTGGQEDYARQYAETLRQIEQIKWAQKHNAERPYDFYDPKSYGSSPATESASAQRLQMKEMEARVLAMQKSVDDQMRKNHAEFYKKELEGNWDWDRYRWSEDPKDKSIPPGSRGSAKTASRMPDDFYDAFSRSKDSYQKAKKAPIKPKKSKPEDITMANKFLPFIVEKSTPEHIYQTLLSRSKGMNMNLVTSIFYMVVDKGVAELRDFVKTLPDGISVTQMYEEMVGKYAHYQIMDEDLNLFVDLAPILGSHDWHEIHSDATKGLESKDILAFLFVMQKIGKIKDYTTLDFERYFDPAKRSDVLANLGEYVTFSDNGQPREFANHSELKTFILYHALLKSEGEDDLPPTKVVFIKGEDDDNA